MATAISPIRIAWADNLTCTNTGEEIDIDFDLSTEEGIEIFRTELSVVELLIVPGGTNVFGQAVLSLHVETGTLEEGVSPTADSTLLNSEIIHLATVSRPGDNTAGSIAGVTWLSPPTMDYLATLGRPFLAAQNLTFRVEADAITTVTNAKARIWYRYVRLTRDELMNQFLARR